jgi:SlyX protein
MKLRRVSVPSMSEQRMTELEMRYMVQQDLLQQLSDVVLEQGRRLDTLRRELELLRSRQSEAPSPTSADERPPHY